MLWFRLGTYGTGKSDPDRLSDLKLLHRDWVAKTHTRSILWEFPVLITEDPTV